MDIDEMCLPIHSLKVHTPTFPDFFFHTLPLFPSRHRIRNHAALLGSKDVQKILADLSGIELKLYICPLSWFDTRLYL